MPTRFLTGQRLTADLLNANVYDFFPVSYSKAGPTARTSTTTYADDPELQGIPLSVGTWEIEFTGFWTCSTTNTQRIKTQWGFTGTWTPTFRSCIGAGSTNVTSPGAIETATFSAYVTDSQDAIYSQNSGAVYGTFRELARNVAVSTAGNLSLKWAQFASSANATTLQATSGFTVRKIS